jgi:glycosyltransferase involved in cell wall biosynthesis
MKPICEIRVPTYRRPQPLLRALRSLQSQTLTNWLALVMDDSPEREAENTVRQLGDDRIHYCPNPVRLNCCGNLDQAFARESAMGAEFACVLEDDNWLLPTFLEENISSLRASSASVLLRNQWVYTDGRKAENPAQQSTTRGSIFEEGIISPLRLRASIFFCEGISNGGLFWSTASTSELQVGETVETASLQEYCRSLKVLEPIYFASEPLCVFNSADNSFREYLSHRMFNRGRQSIIQKLYEWHGSSLVQEARALARNDRAQAAVSAHLCGALVWREIVRLPWTRRNLLSCAKGLAKQITIDDPLDAFWSLQS